MRLDDGPLMRHYNLRGLKMETAGQGGGRGASESNLIGVVDAVQFRDAILRQRQQVLGANHDPITCPRLHSLGRDRAPHGDSGHTRADGE